MPKHFTLVALASGLSLAKPKSENDLPDRLRVCPWGKTETRKGVVICNETTLADLPGNQAANKHDRVAFDFQHNTVKPGPEPKFVAGYGDPEVVRGEGIYLSNIEYTPEGRAALAGGHYPDISPAVMRNEKGEVIFLHSVGACRQGEIDGLTLFSAGDSPDLSSFEAEDGEDDADPARADLRGVLLGLIAAIAPDLEIGEDATDAALAAAAREAAAKLKPAEGDQEPAAMSAEMSARFTALEARIESRERRALLDQASREGKVIPLSADEIAQMDLTLLESMIGQLPVTVPMESRIGGAIDDFQAGPGRITPEAREVARQLGLKPEDIA